MAKLTLAILATVAIVVFAICNSHHVSLSFAVGEPIEIRLIFLLLTAFLAGMAVPIFHRLFRGLERQKLMKRASELQLVIERAEQDIAA